MAEEATVSIAAKPLLPTEYVQCERMHRENRDALRKLGERVLKCAGSECRRDMQGGDYRWIRPPECSPGYGTCPSCVAVATDRCNFQVQVEEALDECRRQVAAYRKLHELWTSTDEERQETEHLLRLLNDGVIDGGSQVLRRPADKLFELAAKHAQTEFDAARRQLNDSIDSWALAESSASPPSEELLQAQQYQVRDAFIAMAVWTATWGQTREEDEVWSKDFAVKMLTPVLLIIASEGDARAAYLLGRLHEPTSETSALSYYLRSAVLGYSPATERVGAHLLGLGIAERGLAWLELASGEGSAAAQTRLDRLARASSSEGRHQEPRPEGTDRTAPKPNSRSQDLDPAETSGRDICGQQFLIPEPTESRETYVGPDFPTLGGWNLCLAWPADLVQRGQENFILSFSDFLEQQVLGGEWYQTIPSRFPENADEMLQQLDDILKYGLDMIAYQTRFGDPPLAKEEAGLRKTECQIERVRAGGPWYFVVYRDEDRNLVARACCNAECS